MTPTKATPAKPTSVAKPPQTDKPIFQLKVEGTYWADGQIKALRKSYTVTVNIPADKIASVNGILKTRILPQLLAKKDPQFKRIRTFSVLSVVAFGDASIEGLDEVHQIRIMDRKQLLNLVKRKKLEMNPELYTKLSDLRTAIQLCIENPNFYKKREAKLSGELALSSELEDLNTEASVETQEEKPLPEEGQSEDALKDL